MCASAKLFRFSCHHISDSFIFHFLGHQEAERSEKLKIILNLTYCNFINCSENSYFKTHSKYGQSTVNFILKCLENIASLTL